MRNKTSFLFNLKTFIAEIELGRKFRKDKIYILMLFTSNNKMKITFKGFVIHLKMLVIEK